MWSRSGPGWCCYRRASSHRASVEPSCRYTYQGYSCYGSACYCPTHCGVTATGFGDVILREHPLPLPSPYSPYTPQARHALHCPQPTRRARRCLPLFAARAVRALPHPTILDERARLTTHLLPAPYYPLTAYLLHTYCLLTTYVLPTYCLRLSCRSDRTPPRDQQGWARLRTTPYLRPRQSIPLPSRREHLLQHLAPAVYLQCTRSGSRPPSSARARPPEYKVESRDGEPPNSEKGAGTVSGRVNSGLRRFRTRPLGGRFPAVAPPLDVPGDGRKAGVYSVHGLEA
jgi:hypothetical protein